MLSPMRSDKYKPVRESTTEALIEVKKIPDEINHQTFSPRQKMQNTQEMNE